MGVLSDRALVEDITFEERGIRPAFFRVSAAWKEKTRKEKVREEEAREEEAREELAVLRARGIEAGIEAAPLEPIYRKPAYRAQHGETPKATCPVAERQADRRFFLTF
jgi:hypothetical protein